MADELSNLGVDWVDECALRRDVVASVDAKVDSEAVADDEELRRRWIALEEMERTVADLQDKLRVFPSDAALLRFQLMKAEREVETRAKALHRWQLELEVRQSHRLEESRRRQAQIRLEEISVQGKPPSNPLQPITPSSVAIRIKTEEPPSTAAAVVDVSTPVAPTSLSDLVKDAYALRSVEVPTNAAAALRSGLATELPRSSASHRTVEDYAGGAILPSLCRVTLSRSDVRAKSRKYADDGDIKAYQARQEMRRRLEEAAARIAAPSAKEEPASQDDSMTRIKVEGESEERVTSVATVDVIDVDALMEEADVRTGVEVLERAIRSTSSTLHVNPPRPHQGAHQAQRQERRQQETPSAQREVIVKRENENVVIAPGGFTLPATIHHRLLDYQRDGVRWLLQLHVNGSGGILGDEMGLGKTIQIAVLLNALHGARKLHGPCLIAAPLTVLRQWVAELHRWAPYVRVCVMHESSASGMSRTQLIQSVRGTPSVVLTTYTALRQHCQLLHAAGFQYIILDEGHKICNPDATVTLAAKSFPTQHRLILSGTPIQNALKELWCLFDFVKPGLLGTMSKFVDEFEEPINESKNLRSSPLVLATAVECARALQERIAPYLLRRLKKDVMAHALPQKFERVIRCPLSDAQLEAYVTLVASPRVQRMMSETLSYVQMYGGLNRDGRDAEGSLHTAGRRFHLMQKNHNNGVRLDMFRVLNELRQICNHVDIYQLRKNLGENAVDEDVDDYMGVKRRRHVGSAGRSVSLRSNRVVNHAGSGKLMTLIKLLTIWKRGGQRVLIFSQTRMMLDIIENMCEQEGHRYIRMDGTTNSHHRQELMDRFNEDDSIFVALLTTRVGGIGVNLIGADRVVIFDPDWNPVTDEQARERAWRIGQKRDVSIYRLIASGTVEESILRRQLAKTYVTDKVLQDPSLQRFFAQNETLAETFYLGAEYDPRIPTGRKHVMVAQELCPLLEPTDEVAEAEAAVFNLRGANRPAANDAEESAETSVLRHFVDGNAVSLVGVDSVSRRLARLAAEQKMLRVSGVGTV